MGNVANPENPTFALSDFDEVLRQKISALYQCNYLLFKRFIKPKTKKTKPTSIKK